MSSAPFDPSNDYQAPPAPFPAKVERENWNAVMRSISERIRVIEGKGTELEDLIADLSFNGQARLDEAIVPLIDETKAELARLQAEVAETIAANGEIIENFQTDIAAALAALNSQIAAVEERVNEILQGGIPADDVAESATRVFVSPAQKEEIGQLREDLTAGLDRKLSAADGAVGEDNLADGAVIRKKLAGSTYSTLTEALAGNAIEGAMAPAMVKAAAKHFAAEIVFQELVGAGNFAKEADDVAYIIEMQGGGGGGGGAGPGDGGSSIQAAGGGGAGAPWVSYIVGASSFPDTIPFAVGAGGAGGAVALAGSAGSSGGTGGTTSFGAISVVGGAGGQGGRYTTNTNTGTTPGGVGQNGAGSGGSGAGWAKAGNSGENGQGLAGPGGGGGGFDASYPAGRGGTSAFASGGAGGGPKSGDPSLPPGNGVGPGAGGGGGFKYATANNGKGGNGSAGILRVTRLKGGAA